MLATTSKNRPQPRKRNRKRKRRNISSSESSSDSESARSSSASEGISDKAKRPIKAAPRVVQEASSQSSSETDSSHSDSESDSREPPVRANVPPAGSNQLPPAPPHLRSESPHPPTGTISNFLPGSGCATEEEKEKEAALKERFRKFWMVSMADGFSADLNEIRKEPNLTSSRLALLIDSLAVGADIFTSSSAPGGSGVNEMEVVLKGQS